MTYDSTYSILIAILQVITGESVDASKYDSNYSVLLAILNNMGVAPEEAQQIILNLAAEVTEIEPAEGETVEEGVTNVAIDVPEQTAYVDNNGVLHINN